MPALSSTLPDLLQARAVAQSNAHIVFLSADGSVSKALSYAELFDIASLYARRLLAAGLTESDVVLASFADHESHIYLFWACCLAGIPFCPLPALHPDPTQQVKLFTHLQSLFCKPTLVGSAQIIQGVRTLVPDLKALVLEELPAFEANKVYPIFPTRKPSPNDTVCFMLTSGSTGNSKAVLLRHSNLLSSVRGKIRHHDTNADSRFLNWIAFDHVASISEVHIHALEANASQWHVSPAAIIQDPMNLLRWASMLSITYTFSPNFLLAAILRNFQASSFSDYRPDLSNLKALISGGEAVPMKTAVAFADIIESFGAQRDVLRAGFGMSETGAGCIYDTRPIPKVEAAEGPKYLSLGKACEGVKMRVFDANSGRICSPGEAGQLQLSGPTVFSGYYNNEHATAESMTDDGWFVTGDLAHLDSLGNLSLVGRDKDCININGVKYPTQDVEQYVEDAKIAGVQPSHLFVCPMRLADADTETYCVFYQHDILVEADLDSAQKRAIRTANRSIKAACMVFCSQAPHVVLPLPRSSFVKTTIGKVSRSLLSKGYLQGNFEALQAALDEQDGAAGDEDADMLTSPVEIVVANALSTTFSIDVSSLRRSQNIFDMGGSSMHLIRAKQLIQDGLSLPDLLTIEMLKRPQVSDLCDYLTQLVTAEEQRDKDVIPEYNPMVCLNSSGSKPPLFLVHPGMGEILVFVALAQRLAPDRPVYALRARGFDHDEVPFDNIKDMADCYRAAIEKVYPNGPYNLAGYSFGAAVAFEIGKSLEARGKYVAFFGSLNLPPHIQFRMRELSWVKILLNIAMFLSLIPDSEQEPLRLELEREFPELVLNGPQPDDPRSPILWLFERVDKNRLQELDIELEPFTRWVNVAHQINYTGRSFEPQGCIKNATTCVFCAIPLPSMGTREVYKRDRLSVWGEFSGKHFDMVDVEGMHYTLLSPQHIDSFAERMKGALERAESFPIPSQYT